MTTMVVVGGSLAGCHAAASIRASGFGGELVVVGDESHMPYDRPPLSKEFLTSGGDETRLPIRSAAADRLEAQWRLGVRAEELDPDRQLVKLSDGTDLNYDGLVVATGASARPLRLADGQLLGAPTASESTPDVDSGVVTLRSLNDGRRLLGLLGHDRPRVVICGAGFIGLEVASSARQLGLDVTVVDIAAAPLSRVLDASVGVGLAEFLTSNGVELLLDRAVTDIAMTDSRISTVALSDGERRPADLLVIGVGAVPNTDWLRGSGVALGEAPEDGLLVDAYCRVVDNAGPDLADTSPSTSSSGGTSRWSNIVAAGDVARWPNQRFGGRSMRVEQWDNAVEMGKYAGRSLASQLGVGPEVDEPFQPVPWFWSDQFGRKIQLAGVLSNDWHDTVGDPHSERFARAYFEGSTLCGVLAWNRPRQAIIGRQLIATGAQRNEALERLTPSPAA